MVMVVMVAPHSAVFAKGDRIAKNIILLIGDGMGPSQFWAAQLYSSRILKKDLNMFAMMKEGNTAYIVNDTADSTVTESAAAAGQIATGERMVARTISMKADGTTEVKTILEMAKEKGIVSGLVTTSGITDATPAAFSSHVPRRYEEDTVAVQQVKLGVDVLMGGRKQFFLPASKGGKRKDGRDITAEALKSGYTFVETARDMNSFSGPGKLLGLFNMSNMSWEMTRGKTEEPSLAEMTAKTVQLLSKNKKGFFAMIEGGKIDHAAHANDVVCMIHDVLAFDEAVGVAMAFAKKNPDTLVLITADHETGGFAMIGKDKVCKEYVGLNFEAIAKITVPFDFICEIIEKDPSPAKIKSVVKQYLSIELTDEEAGIVSADQLKKMDPYNYSYDYSHSLAFVLRPYLRAGWTGQTHTATPLYLFGTGPGSKMIKGIMHNTEIFQLMKKAFGLK